MSCIYVKCSDGQYLEPAQVNIKDDTAEKFLGQLLVAATMCRRHLTNEIPMKCLTQEQWREYSNATNCSIYAKPFKSAEKKSCNHDHLMGDHRGPAHNTCNLNYHSNPKKMKIPCIIHNLKSILFLCYSYFLLVFEIYFNSYFMILILIAIFFISLYKFCKFHFVDALQIKVLYSADIFLGIFCTVFYIICIAVSGYDSHLILAAVKPRHQKINVTPTTWSATLHLQSTTTRS